MATATLTTLTPVHVGSGQTLKKGFDFVQESGHIGIIDLNKVVALIGEDSISQLSAAIEKGEPISEFLKRGRGIRDYSLQRISHRVATANGIPGNATELKEQYRVALKGACIPGSALKGALKTGLWNTFADEQTLANLNAADLKNRNGKWTDALTDKRLSGKDPNEKSTRFLKIGDVHFHDLQTEVVEVGIYNAYRNGWDFKQGNSFLVEVIPTGKSAVFEIKFDTLLLQRNLERYPERWQQTKTDFLQNGHQWFCNLINTHTRRLIEQDFEDLQNADFGDKEEEATMFDHLDPVYNAIVTAEEKQVNEAYLRVGGHNGWMFTTGGWIKRFADRMHTNEMTQLRKAIQRRDYTDMNLWPKTRKMTMGGIPLGFVKIVFE